MKGKINWFLFSISLYFLSIYLFILFIYLKFCFDPLDLQTLTLSVNQLKGDAMF